MTRLVRSRAELAAARAQLAGPVALVPTMGALHAGHDANMAAARAAAAGVIVSIFINPMQFDRPADLERYPRSLDSDVQRCAALGVDVVWAPEVETVYQNGPVGVAVTAPGLGAQLEGASRPGHFDGVLTVVAKLFGLVRPDLAFFGEKDYQQLMLIKQMVTDLELGVQVRSVPTVRDDAGLALSSRNAFLTAEQRTTAVRLSSALRAAQLLGAAPAEAVLETAAAALAAGDDLRVDYLQLRGPQLEPNPGPGPARLLVAAWVGNTRLIDNMAVELAGGA